MKSIYTNIKINNEKVKRSKRKIQNEQEPRRFWSTVLHILLTTIFMAVGILLGIGLFLFLFYSPYFNLARVEVSPMTQIGKEEILDLANIKLNSNLLMLRSGTIVAKVSAHPWVEQVQIQKRFPDKVRIEVVERKPVAIICGKEMFGIDEEGYLLPGIRMEVVKDLPLITVNDSMLAGSPDRITAPAMNNAIYVIKYLTENDPAFLKEISELNITAPDNLVLYTLHEGTEIRLGNDNLPERLAKLQQVWQIVRQQQVVEEYIDLRFDKQGIVTKPKAKTGAPGPIMKEPSIKT
ncbi:MAG: FtsQ-type POTRA domain-containing protein [bacterium]|nr:FtsQ-type POTRA domain-containing protein [bacterium]